MKPFPVYLFKTESDVYYYQSKIDPDDVNSPEFVGAWAAVESSFQPDVHLVGSDDNHPDLVKAREENLEWCNGIRKWIKIVGHCHEFGL